VTDTFCTTGKHAIWEKRIAYVDFLKKLGLSTESFSDPELQLCYYSSSRNNRVSLGDRNFDAITMRSALGLKSTWFSIELDLDTVVFSGRGFGHGVGVCQEGAIGMAAYGCSAEEILNHYYRSTLFFNTRKNEVISVLFE
jgi:stage II sporulation protein D